MTVLSSCVHAQTVHALNNLQADSAQHQSDVLHSMMLQYAAILLHGSAEVHLGYIRCTHCAFAIA